MSKENFWDKFKNLFVEEKKYKKPKEYIIEGNVPTTKNEENDNKDNEIKNLINDIISGNNKTKEDIIKALKQCEKIYYDEEKQLQIMFSIKEMQNDPDILKAFIDETVKYSRFEGSEHYQIRKARAEAIKKLNKINLKEILKAQINTYNYKKNIIKVINAIKNEQILFQTKEKQRESIIKIYNNIDDILYEDIQVLEALFQVFDNKMRNNRTEEIKKITDNLKRRINIYYNTEGTKEEKIYAIRQIPLPKIEENIIDEPLIDNKKDEPKKIDESIKTEKIKENTNNNEEYTPVDYASILETQEARIRNAESITEEEKQKLIDELYKEFEAFVGEINKPKTI